MVKDRFCLYESEYGRTLDKAWDTLADRHWPEHLKTSSDRIKFIKRFEKEYNCKCIYGNEMYGEVRGVSFPDEANLILFLLKWG